MAIKSCFTLLLIVLLVSTLSASTVAASSTGDWTMFRQSPSRTGQASSGSASNSVQFLWAYPTGASVWSSPAVADSRVLVGCKSDDLLCLNATTGSLIWSFKTGGEVNSSPAIYDGSVYVGSDDGYLYCINLATGKAEWKMKLGVSIRSSPTVVDDCVYVGSGSHGMFCLNASDGATLWSFPTTQTVNSSPAVADGTVYFACEDGYVYALNSSSGMEIWRHRTVSTQASPCLSNGCLYIGSYDGWFFCLNASTGDEVWRFLTQDTVVSCAAADSGYVYFGSEDCNIYCLNASIGEEVWRYKTDYWVWSSPAVAGGNLYVGSQDYNLYCLDAQTGALKWSYLMGCNVDSSPAIVNNTLYVGSHDYYVHALTLSNASVANASMQKTPDQLSWNTVVFDVLACAVAAATIVVLVRYVQSARRKTKANAAPSGDGQIKNWFLTHENWFCAALIGAFSILFFLNISSGPLWVADEKTYSQMAYHMVKSGDYFFPWSLGEQGLWIGKPPFLMWLMSLAYQAFGVTNFASRVWLPLFGAASLVLVFFLAKKLFNTHVGLLSVVVLGTFGLFFDFATHAMTDGPLVCFMLASMYFLLLSEEPEKANLYGFLSGLFFGLALMTKQLEALLIPFIMIVYFAVTKRSLRFLFTKQFALFLGVALLIFLPWVVYMDLRFKDFWDTYFVYSDFSRIVTPLEGRTNDYLFYFKYLATSENQLWVALLPFSVGLVALKTFIKRSKADTLLLVWIVTILLFFTLAQTKLYWYILPVIPAFSIAIGYFMFELMKQTRLNLSRLHHRHGKPSNQESTNASP